MRLTGRANMSSCTLMRALIGLIPKCLGSRLSFIRTSLFHTFLIGSLFWRPLPGDLYCLSVPVCWSTACIRNGHPSNPFSSSCIVFFFLTCTCRFLLTRSWWTSFRHSTWCRVSCTRIRGVHASLSCGMPNFWRSSFCNLFSSFLYASSVRPC